MNELTHTTDETQPPNEPEQEGKACPDDPTRLSEAEYASLRHWLETHYPPLKLSKYLSSILSSSSQANNKKEEPALKECQAPLLDWLQEIYHGIIVQEEAEEAPFDAFPATPLRDWLLSTAPRDVVEVQTGQTGQITGDRSADAEIQAPHRCFKDMLLRLIRSLERDRSRAYEREYGGLSSAPTTTTTKYACRKCGHEIWLRV